MRMILDAFGRAGRGWIGAFLVCWMACWTPSAAVGQAISGVTRFTDEVIWRERLADLLYPESMRWLRVAASPAPPSFDVGGGDGGTRRRLVGALEGALRGRSPDWASCVVARIFRSDEAREWMRIVDVTGANRRDLIYAGPSGCDEGSLTLVWQDYLAADVRPPLEISGIALRIAVEADPVFLSFIGGCCADPMNEFVLRRPLPLRRRMWLDSVRVHNTLLLPDGIVADRRDIVFDREFVLRRAPVEDDAYDEAASGFHGHAVFGTGLRKFMPGVTARQLGRFRDEAGSVFALVRVDREAGAKAIYSVVPIDVGWVRVGGQ